MTWSNRADNIGQRDWSDIIVAWSEINRNFDTATFLDGSLEDSVESALQPNRVSENSLIVLEFDSKTLLLSELGPVDKPNPDPNGCKDDKGREALNEFIVAGCDAS